MSGVILRASPLLVGLVMMVVSRHGPWFLLGFLLSVASGLLLAYGAGEDSLEGSGRGLGAALVKASPLLLCLLSMEIMRHGFWFWLSFGLGVATAGLLAYDRWRSGASWTL